MMKSVIVAAALVLSALSATAQDFPAASGDSLRQSAVVSSDSSRIQDKSAKKGKGPWDRKKIMNVAYAVQTLSPDFGNSMEGSLGVALVSGRSFYLHRKPIAGLLKFSLDFGSDINYVKYRPLDGDYNISPDSGIGISGRHQADIGLFFGPAVTANPVSDLKIGVYFRVVPSYSLIMTESDVLHGFVPYFTYGGEVSWRWIGAGVEGRSGVGTYSSLMGLFGGASGMKSGYGTEALRFYLAFRF